MAVEVPQNEEIFGGGKNVGGKGVGSAIHRRKAYRGSKNTMERKWEGVV